MAKVKNIGSSNYVSAGFECSAGEVAEVSDERAAYLLSDECPGSFEKVADAPAKKAGK